MELSTTLAPGDYELEVQLGSSLRSNNVNDHMLAQVLATATENIEATASGQRFYEQIKALLESSLQRPTSDEQVTQMLNVLTEVAVDASSRGDWFFDEQSRCDTWSIWPGEELTHEENMVRYGDPVGMMRGWTALLHGIMTSYEYLHD